MFLFKKRYDSIDINEISSVKNPKLIDVRSKNEYQSGTIKFAKNIEMNKLLEYPSKYLNKSDEYYLFCASGMRSKATCNKLAKLGYKVVNLKGGIFKYKG